MPRYYGYTDPGEYYQGTPFDPMTGRLQGGQMIAQLLNQIAGNKRRKQEEAWEVEDRAFQEKQRGWAEEQAGLDLAAKRREAQDYQAPLSPLVQEMLDRMKAKRGHKQELEKIEARKKADLEVEKAKGGIRAATQRPQLSFDAAYQYTKKIENFFPKIASERARLESDLEKPSAEYGKISSLAEKNPKSVFKGMADTLKKQIEEGESRRSALSELEARLRAIWSALRAGQTVTPEGADLIEQLLSTDLLKVKSGKSKAELSAESSGITIDKK